MRKATRIKTYMARLYCDKCSAEMRYWGPTEIPEFDDPEYHLHRCPECNAEQKTRGRYPGEVRIEEGKGDIRDDA